MKNVKKLAAVAMALTMAFNLVGCAGGGKLGESKLKSAAKKFGAEQIKDVDDFDDLEEDDFEDGVYITASGDDLKEFLERIDSCYYDKSINTATVFVYLDSSGDLIIIDYTFSSKKDAEAFFDGIRDEFEDLSSVLYADHDDGEENGINYCIMHDSFYEMSGGAYQSNNNVLVVYALDDFDDEIEDVLGVYDVILPEDA
ncbi:MAG: hypothetical protein MJ103_01350 [Saccharofermentans sp.]|nr:hypothetical protein [Saccharofermentans sp.]